MLSHPEIIQRRKRADGHLRSLVAMLEDLRSCDEIAQQLPAVESAIGNAKKALAHDHIDHGLKHVVRRGAQDAVDLVRAFKAIAKYLWIMSIRETSLPWQSGSIA